MGFCPYITANLITSSAVDGTSSIFTYSVSEYNCPQNTTCQVWDAGAGDCGSKNPSAGPSGTASPSSLLSEFLNKADSDSLDLTPLGVTGEVYGHDYIIDDPENIPIILKAAHDHPDFEDSEIIDGIEGNCSVTNIAGDSTSDWEYEIEVIDGTSDFTSSLVTTSMYIVFLDGDGEVISSHQIESVDYGNDTLIINLGLSEMPPFVEGNYAFIIDRKRITWEEYLGLFP